MERLVKRPVADLRGPRGAPLLGPLGSLMRFFADPVKHLLALSRFGDVVAMADRDAALVCAFGKNHNRTILSDARLFENVADVPIPVPAHSAPARITNNALTSMNGELHKSRRRMVMPLFTKAAVERHHDATVFEIERSAAALVPGARIDASAAMTKLSLAIALRCLFGLDATAEGQAIAALSVAYLESLTDPLAMLLPVDLPATPYRRLMRVSSELETRVLGQIADRRNAAPGEDVLSRLIRARDEDGSAMADVELVGQVNVFFVAGFETTANTLAWTLFLLSQHPEETDAVVAELDRVLGGRTPSIDDVPKLAKLDRVVRESMRLLPATPFLFMRRATEDFSLGRHALPKGTLLFLSPLVAHRDPSAFPDPTIFRPSRWETASPGPYEYMPFGAGPRLCIGASFAAQTIRLVLATLLQRVRPVLAEGAKVSRRVRGIVLASKHGLPMRLVAPSARAPVVPAKGNIHDLVTLPT